MKTLNQHFLGLAKEAIKDSEWFRSAPKAAQGKAKFKLLGIEQQTVIGVFGSAETDFLFVEVRCGGVVGMFRLRIGDLSEVKIINEE